MAYVKVRKIGARNWVFLTRNGVNRLKVHAARFENLEKAQALIDANAADNPEWEFKAVAS